MRENELLKTILTRKNESMEEEVIRLRQTNKQKNIEIEQL